MANNFDHIGMSDVEFGYGMVQALSCGPFLWTDSSTPINLSAFRLTEGEPLQKEMTSKYLLMHIVAKEGKGKTAEELKEQSK